MSGRRLCVAFMLGFCLRGLMKSALIVLKLNVSTGLSCCWRLRDATGEGLF